MDFINCFNRFGFLAEVITYLQKRHYFGQFKDNNSGGEKRKLDKWPLFFICVLSSNCLWYWFLYLKIVKIHFHWGPHLVHSGLQNIWILYVKAVRSAFCPVRFRKHWNIELRICLISWSISSDCQIGILVVVCGDYRM